MSATITAPTQQQLGSARATLIRARHMALSLVTAAATVRAHLDGWTLQSDAAYVHDQAAAAERIAASLTRRANRLRHAVAAEDANVPRLYAELDNSIDKLHRGEQGNARAAALILARFQSLKDHDALPF
ncbi:hypothetical protein [Actinacidiphila sp. bgisy160]|uniref:hypothetical protein n=1 Tax=Actinacidiphila sp. bgisy160 TaxID=3413796 RepID=UPI003D75806A